MVRISQEGSSEGNRDKQPPGRYSPRTGAEVSQGRPAGSDVVLDLKVQKSQEKWGEGMERERKSVAGREESKCGGPKVRWGVLGQLRIISRKDEPGRVNRCQGVTGSEGQGKRAASTLRQWET